MISRFMEMTGRRAWGEDGPSTVPWSDVSAWLQITQYKMTKRQLRTLLKMDVVFCREVQIEIGRIRKREAKK